MILFCLPNAGGNASSYSSWKHSMTSCKVIPIEYAGHGKRYEELYYETFTDALEEIYQWIESESNFEDYIILGHSMGGLLAYELYYYINARGKKLPRAIFLAGVTPPSHIKKNNYPTLSNHKLLKKVKRMGGIPKGIERNTAMMTIIADNLRNDYRIMNTYDFKYYEVKISAPVFLLVGKKDIWNRFYIGKWRQFIEGEVQVKKFKGGHFFIREEEVVQYIDTVLQTHKIENKM